MYLCQNARIVCRLIFLFFVYNIGAGCHEKPGVSGDEFFKHLNETHGGDYWADYPIHNPDSCLLRLQAEIPSAFQPQGCLSIWYRLPRTTPQKSFHFLDLYEKNYPQDTVHAFAQLMRGEFYVSFNQLDSAKICVEDAYRIYHRLDKTLDISDAKLLLGRINVYQNNFASALESYFEALDLLNSQDTTFSERHSILYRDIAAAYRSSHNVQEERKWYYKAWNADYAKFEDPWSYKSKLCGELCRSYLPTNPDSSLLWANRAKEIFETHLKRPLPPKLLYAFGRSYYELGRCPEALTFLQQAYRKNQDRSEAFSYYQFTQGLGQCFKCVGQLDSAEYYLHLSLATPDTANLSVLHRQLSDIHAARGDYKSALEDYKESFRLFQMRYTTEQVKATADMQTRYETVQKERRISELETAHLLARQQNLITALLLIMVLGVLFVLFFRQRIRHRLLEQTNQLLAQEKELAETRERLKTEQLEHSQATLITTQNELDSTARLLALKNQLVEELELRLNNQHLAPSESSASSLIAGNELRRMKILTETDWIRFRERFDDQMPGFLRNLSLRFPTLTAAEIRLFLLLKLNFDTLEISEALGISKESVWRSRNRLRKKLNIADTEDLTVFIRGF